jgi:LmbE family N-acetylglucosaminyl deacetylase
VQALIASYARKNISVYAPSIFSDDITHPDHKVLHEVVADIAKDFPDKNVTFYFYEDMPYTIRFNKQALISVRKNIETIDELFLEPVNIALTKNELNQKMSAIGEYSSQVKALNSYGTDVKKDIKAYMTEHCEIAPACEMVYKVIRY